MRGHRRKTDSTVIDSDRKMSWLQNHLPDGPGTATAESERDPMVEADELALSKIRNMCAVAMTSAEGVAQPIQTDMTRLHGLRFASSKRMSLELAKTIYDIAYHNAALRHIIDLCTTANDMEASRILVPAFSPNRSAKNSFGRAPPYCLDPSIGNPTLISINASYMRQRLLAKGGHGATNAPDAILLLCWRRAARTVVHFGRVLSEAAGFGKGESLSARHSYLFRPEMARAHRLRYQPPDDRSDIDGKYGANHSGAPNDCQ
jgi:hypothetical protein